MLPHQTAYAWIGGLFAGLFDISPRFKGDGVDDQSDCPANPTTAFAFLTRPERGRDLFSFVTRPMNGTRREYKLSTSTAPRPRGADTMDATMREVLVSCFRVSGRMTFKRDFFGLEARAKSPIGETNLSILDPCNSWPEYMSIRKGTKPAFAIRIPFSVLFL
jgi:hypothetical protein